MRYLLYVLPIFFIVISCGNPNLDESLEMPPMYKRIGFHKDQIKFWLKDQNPTKDNDSSLVYRYYEADYIYEEIVYFLDSNKVSTILKSYFYTDMDYQKYSSEKRFSDWITELRREQFTDEGSKVVKDKKSHIDGLMAKMLSSDKKFMAFLLFNWNDWTKEATTTVMFSKNDQ